MEPESEGNVGAEMARLRMRFGLSQQDVSNRLHIRVRYIQAMEENKFELLPGKVYARGYLHTYAEFLGLDPVTTVEKCLLGAFESPPALSKSYAPPLTSSHRVQKTHGVWKLLAAALVVICLVVVGSKSSLQRPSQEDVAPSDRSSAVPESMLRHMRSMPMPTAWNYDCLTGRGQLSCFYTDPLLDAWLHPEIFSGLAYVGEIDLSTAVEPPPVEAKPVEEKPVESDPAAEKPTTEIKEEDPSQAKSLGALEPAAGAKLVESAKPVEAIAPTAKKEEKRIAPAKAPPHHSNPVQPKPVAKTQPKSNPITKPFPPLKAPEKPTPSIFDEIDHNAIGLQHD